MFKNKLLASILLVLAVLFAQVGNVAAAPQTQDTTPPEITKIETETDANNVTTVLVTLLYADQTEEVVRISYDYAVSLGLIDSETQQPVAIEDLPEGITIDPDEVIRDEEPVEENVHPIAALLADFFGEDASVIDQYHEDGFGFGVIAQALWMSRNITENEDASAAGCILEARQNGTYGECFDFGDEPVPTNWGQFKKALKENKEKHNLGVIVSGQADEDQQESVSPQDHGNNQERDKGPGNGHGNGQDKKKNKP
jgi:ABC-type glycerol-3-phosphate transport system substrate-binding protein